MEYIMTPGDTFVAKECGCAFTVTAGPNDESMATQAPQCCCGHAMIKQQAGQGAGAEVPANAVDPVGA